MRYLSVCSGIEAATVAWHPLGWAPVAFAEIEPFPAAVLQHHWPHVPNLGDMTKIDGRQYRDDVDILVGGTPCQAFSIAGLRQGLSDARGNLTLTFVELADAIQPSFILWENVPGVLSSKDNAFGCLLAGLAGENEALLPSGKRWTDAGCVYGPTRTVAWRTLDAQYFSVAQRRRRVFVVACPRGGADPCKVLFEWEGQRRDAPPRRKDGEGQIACTPESISGTVSSKWAKGSGGPSGDEHYNLIVEQTVFSPVAPTVSSSGPPYSRPGNSRVETDAVIVCRMRQGKPGGGKGPLLSEDLSLTLATANDQVVFVDRPRKFMPIEGERLQGFPDDHTDIPWKGAAHAPDTLRWKAIGNSMCVNVMRWIGERINNIEHQE